MQVKIAENQTETKKKLFITNLGGITIPNSMDIARLINLIYGLCSNSHIKCVSANKIKTKDLVFKRIFVAIPAPESLQKLPDKEIGVIKEMQDLKQIKAISGRYTSDRVQFFFVPKGMKIE